MRIVWGMFRQGGIINVWLKTTCVDGVVPGHYWTLLDG